MNIPGNLKYTKNDEWVRVEGKIGVSGVTDYAQEQLSDVVYVEIVVSEGDVVSKGDTCATIESVKAAADVYLPVSGKVVAVNANLPDSPEKVNSDPYGEAWMVKVEMSNPEELKEYFDASGYETHIQEKG